jgi:hypothetical protein
MNRNVSDLASTKQREQIYGEAVVPNVWGLPRTIEELVEFAYFVELAYHTGVCMINKASRLTTVDKSK